VNGDAEPGRAAEPAPAAAGPAPILITDDVLETRVEFEKGMGFAPLLCLGLAVVMIVVFGFEVSRGALDSTHAIVAVGAKDNASIRDGELWRLLSPAFLHGGLDHLIGNLLVLYVLGIGCEHLFGRLRTFNLFVGTAMAASLCSCLGKEPSVGASGAIFGLLGALAAALRRHRSRLHVRDGRVVIVLVIWALWSFVTGALDPVVDNRAHLGGFVAGAVLGPLTSVVVGSARPAPAGRPLLVATAAAAAMTVYTAAALLPRLLAA
jgi:membrane associated rhomboid family serine protease